MSIDRDLFREAYQDWVRARVRFDEEMEKIIQGGVSSDSVNTAVFAELERTFGEFMKAGRPFIRWSKR